MTPDTPPTPTDALAAAKAHREQKERAMLKHTANGHGALTVSKAHWDLHDADEAYIKVLEAALAAHEQREARLREALQELYNATRIVERQNPVATEDWHHYLFAATGNASAVLHETNEATSIGGVDDG